jgi:hypothetical protein
MECPTASATKRKERALFSRARSPKNNSSRVRGIWPQDVHPAFVVRGEYPTRFLEVRMGTFGPEPSDPLKMEAFLDFCWRNALLAQAPECHRMIAL